MANLGGEMIHPSPSLRPPDEEDAFWVIDIRDFYFL